MASPRTVLGWPAVAMVGTLLISSCSELQIDVDVYKGPLANHEDVQTEQLAAMAVGTEPLLDRLGGVLQSEIDSMNAQTPPADTKTLENLKDLISAVETLFDDQGGQIGRIMDRGRRAYNKYTHAVWLLDHTEFSPRVMSRLNEIASSDSPENPAKSLAEAYIIFSTPGNPAEGDWRRTKDVFTALKKLMKSGPLTPTDAWSALDADALHKISTNKAYLILRNRRLLEQQAEFLFSNDENTRRLFVDEVSLIANSYVDAREALEQLLLLALEGLPVAMNTVFKSPHAKTGIIDRTSRVIARLIRTEYLLFAVDNLGGDGALMTLKIYLQGLPGKKSISRASGKRIGGPERI